MATHSRVFAWRIPGTGEPGVCRPWGHTESDTTEATQQQQSNKNHVIQAGVTPSVVQGLTASSLHGNRLEMQMVWSQPRPMELDTLGLGPAVSI